MSNADRLRERIVNLLTDDTYVSNRSLADSILFVIAAAVDKLPDHSYGPGIVDRDDLNRMLGVKP